MKYWKMLIIIILLVVTFLLLLGPAILYQPMTSFAERAFLFENEIIHNQNDYEASEALGTIRLIETVEEDIIELNLFDVNSVKMIRDDLRLFYNAIATANNNNRWDIEIIDHETNLEIVIHAKFGQSIFYKQESIVVSKYFSLVMPYIGGIHFSNPLIKVELAYLLGALTGASTYNHFDNENPYTLYISISKDTQKIENGNFKVVNIAYKFSDLSLFDEITSNVTEYVLYSH